MDSARLPVQPPEAEEEEYEKDEDEGLVPAVPENGRNAPYSESDRETWPGASTTRRGLDGVELARTYFHHA